MRNTIEKCYICLCSNCANPLEICLEYCSDEVMGCKIFGKIIKPCNAFKPKVLH